MNSTARVSAAVAVSGGIVAAVAVPQVASASPSAAKVTTASNNHAESAAFVNLGLSSNSAQVSATVADTAAQQSTLLDLSKLVAAAPAAKPLLESVAAKTYTAPVRATATRQQSTTTSSTSRSATRPSAAAATPSNNSASSNSSGNSGSSNSGSSDSGNSGGSSVSLPSGSGNSAAIAIAQRYLGVPYILGGSSPSGFDCSGLTSYVYRQLGISLPRTAAAQQASVPSVSTPQVGDLVFFGYPAYHVGIYAGNGMMIAAPHPGTVVKLQPIYQAPSGYGRP
ncbi:cell wall-associated NlpC family hydrolase [Branchiibius hedensis]|uniref:Cell wall-associated hydrolase, NlpC family n=1 Tax=Branchiibius hedensis TaxID=672460 RepID=A0A2Y8ZUU9_9MICO|nr:cell wall-associated NlpC family hydrolase [Branchiibius hedensis]SSA35276.1 Cell wall-associated hydrolase, NlpC family [Branchiibius hedensis]